MAANSEQAAKGKKPRGPGKPFEKGQSGNPNGRPKRTPEEFELLKACEEKAPEALDTILRLMAESQSDKVRMNAAQFIIERRYGKPTETVKVDANVRGSVSYRANIPQR